MILTMTQVGMLKRAYYDYSISDAMLRDVEDDAISAVVIHVARALSEAVLPYAQIGMHIVDPGDIGVVLERKQPGFNSRLFRFAWQPRNRAMLPTGEAYDLRDDVWVVQVYSPMEFKGPFFGTDDPTISVEQKVITLVRRGWDTEQRAWVMGP